MSTIFIPNSVPGHEPYWGDPTAHMNLSYIALIIVGIGSTLFHMTMKYELQLVDDLSMLLGAATMFHHVLTLDDSWHKKLYVFLAIVITLSLAVWAHVYTGDSALHQVVFGTMVFTVGYKLVKLNKKYITDENLQRKLLNLMIFAIAELTVACISWILDTIVCGALRDARAYVGVPWAWLLELHGWWHNLTALGVYVAMIEGDYLYSVHRGMAVGPDVSYITLLLGPSPSRAKKE
ncbi:hypothetical protein KEM54_001896 [Ascosphaera aggregata]|nr:hypothetical protein KEM54_001896 [Ascosphaera aggregata]